jgi:hypothetical protein
LSRVMRSSELAIQGLESDSQRKQEGARQMTRNSKSTVSSRIFPRNKSTHQPMPARRCVSRGSGFPVRREKKAGPLLPRSPMYTENIGHLHHSAYIMSIIVLFGCLTANKSDKRMDLARTQKVKFQRASNASSKPKSIAL